RARGLGIGALELGVAGLLRHKAPMLACGLQEVRSNGYFGPDRDRRRRRRKRIDRPRRPDIDRRLGEHIIGESDRQMVAALGVADAPFLGHRIPVSVGYLLIGMARLLILRELGLILGEYRNVGDALRAR